MNRAIAEKWIADLRANPPQAKEKLFDGKGHCCLGRLCVLYGLEPDESYRFLGEVGSLPSAVIDWAGMNSGVGSYVVDEDQDGQLDLDNDSGKTFAEIADIIEANIGEL